MKAPYFAGMDCTCAAYGESECGCGADWTDARIYKLRRDCAHLSACLTDERQQNKKLVAEMELLDKEIERLHSFFNEKRSPL